MKQNYSSNKKNINVNTKLNLNKFIDEDLIDIFNDRYEKYAKYILLDRALPDVRDGLKPVQRRILYALYKLNLTYDKNFKKSARTVGEVIAKYHPHGDVSVYASMLRLSQEWKMNVPLIDFQGNNGSIDGDSPAAMRYTEAKLSKCSNYLIENLIYARSNDFTYNFDDSEIEPIIFPTIFPNLLINGSTGIAAGYATEIPPHNLIEVINALIYRIKKPHSYLNEIIKILPAPDFPTGGIIENANDFNKFYKKGKGKIKIYSKLTIENNDNKKNIVITEIPYGVVKSQLIKQIDTIRLNNNIKGLKEIRDESDKYGLRIVIILKSNTNEKFILSYLYKHTNLFINYSFNMITIVNNKPHLLTLLECLDEQIKFSQNVIYNKTQYLLEKEKKRLNIVLGLILILKDLKKAIDLVLKANNKDDAKLLLEKEFKLNKFQSEAIVQLKLYRLTYTSINALKIECEKLKSKISEYKKIIKSDETINEELIKLYSNIIEENKSLERKTSISQNNILHADSDLEMPNIQYYGNLFLYFTNLGNIIKQRKPLDIEDKNFWVNNKKNFLNNNLVTSIITSDKNKIIIFVNDGNCIIFKNFIIKLGSWNHLNDYFKLDFHDKVIANAYALPKINNQIKFYLIITNQGELKLINFDSFKLLPDNKITKFINLKTNDYINKIFSIKQEHKYIFLATKLGRAITYSLENITPTNVRTGTIKGLKLKDNDQIIIAHLFTDIDNSIKLVNNYFLKKSISIKDFYNPSRNTYGYKLFENSKFFILCEIVLNELNTLLYLDINNQKYIVKPNNYELFFTKLQKKYKYLKFSDNIYFLNLYNNTKE